MLYKILSNIDHVVRFDRAKAHCDIPCAIYDPISAQLAGITMLRMVDLITEMRDGGADDATKQHAISRFVTSKEEHGVKCKAEVATIWGDYFKPPHFERFPELHGLSHEIAMLASQCKQSVDRDKTLLLIDRLNAFAEIFWTSKEVSTKRAVCPYPPAVELVYPEL
ncbi:MAG: superoxide dismutase, Ni [Pseudomonadota bacterium]